MGLTNLFPRNRHNDLAEARGSSTGHINLKSSKLTDEITGLKTEKSLKLQVYFKIIASKVKQNRSQKVNSLLMNLLF